MQKINLRGSKALFKLQKFSSLIVWLLYFSLLLRSSILVQLVGIKYYQDGVFDFIRNITIGVFVLDFVQSCAQLVPVTPVTVVQTGALRVFLMVLMNRNTEMLKHLSFLVLILSWSINGVTSRWYYYSKFRKLGDVSIWFKMFKDRIGMICHFVDFINEFLVLFLALRFEHEKYYKEAVQVALVGYLPFRLLQLKQQFTKYSDY